VCSSDLATETEPVTETEPIATIGPLTVTGPVATNDWPSVQMALKGDSASGCFVYPQTFKDQNGKEINLAFQVVAVPIRFMGKIAGTLVLGSPLSDQLTQQLKTMTNSEVAIYLGHKVYASTWPDDKISLLEQGLNPNCSSGEMCMSVNGIKDPYPMKLGRENYLSFFTAFEDVEGENIGDYVIFRSVDQALAPQKSLQETIIIVGALGVLFAFGLVIFIAHRITEPLNSLIKGVKELGQGNLTYQVPVKTRDELGILATSFNEMIQGLEEKERVTNILGKYISPEVAKKVLENKDGIALRGERRECAVMFTDIRGFTAMSENESPEKIVADLNEYFTLLVDVVIKYEGTLDKFIGDAIMAVWGAPVAFEDKELRAVKAALEMQSVLGQFNKQRISKNLTPLLMGVGINTGDVVSGNLGSDKRSDYTVIGAEVNLASRLCSVAAPGQVLISDYVYRKLKGMVEVKQLESVDLKGFTEPVKVYEVIHLWLSEL
jgi:class 3 adenylate cyclase